MYELIQAAKNSYYIQSPAKIGLVKLNETEVCLIDSGNDKDAGKKDSEDQTIVTRLLSGLGPPHDEGASKKQPALNNESEELNETRNVGRRDHSERFDNSHYSKKNAKDSCKSSPSPSHLSQRFSVCENLIGLIRQGGIVELLQIVPSVEC